MISNINHLPLKWFSYQKEIRFFLPNKSVLADSYFISYKIRAKGADAGLDNALWLNFGCAFPRDKTVGIAVWAFKLPAVLWSYCSWRICFQIWDCPANLGCFRKMNRRNNYALNAVVQGIGDCSHVFVCFSKVGRDFLLWLGGSINWLLLEGLIVDDILCACLAPWWTAASGALNQKVIQ